MSTRVTITEHEGQLHAKGFACSCSKYGERRMAALHRWVGNTYFNDPRWPKSHHRLGDPFYVTGILYTLAGTYSAWIEDVPLDPSGWGAITTVAADNYVHEGPGLRTFIQFDNFEDGLALTLRAMYKQYGLNRKVKPEELD